MHKFKEFIDDITNCNITDTDPFINSIYRVLNSGCEHAIHELSKYLDADNFPNMQIYLSFIPKYNSNLQLPSEHQITRFWLIRFKCLQQCDLFNAKKFKRTSGIDITHGLNQQDHDSAYENAICEFTQYEVDNQVLDTLEGQLRLINQVRKIYRMTSQGSHRTKKQRECKLHGSLYFQHRNSGTGTDAFSSLFSPVNTVDEILVQDTSVFASSTFPILVLLRAASNICKIIYKQGDDLTTDMFVLETVKYFSMLLNIQLVTYTVIPLSRTEGLVEVVEGLEFSRIHSCSKLEKYIGTHSDVFIESLSTYSVICYVLGIGDRNPGNMMVTADGSFLHIDFSYVFGNDPKPFCAKISICRPICEYLKKDARAYHAFITNSVDVFVKIRHSYGRIIAFWCLLINSGIFKLDLNEAVRFAAERLMLDYSTADASRIFERNLKSSIGSTRTLVAHAINRIATLLRK
ncbi:phosphoinositide 3-kinase [Ordospora colligata OC4]|uniref:Phosphoinositide 3-kinase n=1 Tax=Ordospora colligata OC4 TaxID=1354746 RepID=A0A0B2UK83_9MICR|nr:phosphoinositide 3-kinase [Ordospora colligata OC4]KHN69644.1 phosphoinositide 3-kinase [Ordospora colligata OC4]TBU15763.1 phosphoinositide 3-kinase [Ordospora colligata]TBU15891.1 phosphoinositide 3-kinase [Ordospora colligata]